MFSVTYRTIGLASSFVVAVLAFGCGNTQAGSTYSDESSATVSQFQVTDAAYFKSGNGTEFLVAGDVPCGELSLVRVSFFDVNSNPVEVDTNNDGIPDATIMDLPASHDTTGEGFFLQAQWNESLSAQVNRVGAQAVDQDGNLSNTLYANLDARPVLTLGDAFDLRGFDVCPDGSTCKVSSSDWQAHCIANPSQ
jgi:hypothetical protein